MKYQTFYFTNIWDLINVMKKDALANYKISVFQSSKKHSYYKWKCVESKTIYQISSFNVMPTLSNFPKVLRKNFMNTTFKDTINWIKENSKAIDSVNKLKSFL